MNEHTPSYRGDAALDSLLHAAGTSYDAVRVRSLVAGVLAAPRALEPDTWMTLVSERRDASLTAQLGALLAELATGYTDGLDVSPAPAARVNALRQELTRRGLAGFIVPRTDEHQNEYVARRAQRLAWLTGFTGSWGAAVVMTDRAALFVDGRYTLQAREESDTAMFEQHHLVDEPPAEWLQKVLSKGQKLAIDPWLHGSDEVATLRAACARAACVRATGLGLGPCLPILRHCPRCC